MKFALCLLAIVFSAVALPAEMPLESPDELDWSKITPENVYIEPINPVKNVDLPESRIIGGIEVAPNSVPYQVGVLINGASFCGGSIISTSRILTAAHCTIRASFVEIRFGAHIINQNEATQVRITSTNIINHRSYNSFLISNDISVVLLPSAVTLNSRIQVIPLAPANAGTFEGARAFLSGWGRDSDASNAISPVLRGVNLNIISNAACRNVFGLVVLSSTICTSGTGTVGACNGDSGGPLVVDGVQVGIVSFGSRSCEAGNPTAYARVTSFRNWITENAGV
ncbi:brachyurin-like [Anoplophora glabripennis]|uniref:brachyurin-like n=1 Tax=Anoplophora glabripennis TaxID=217634 RepID=UPI000C781695|nr:brachyurin-like [Anoplophora glabripennis]